MFRLVWKKFNSSVCSIRFCSNKGIEFFRLSGFRYRDSIITGGCKDELDKCDYVCIEFISDLKDNSGNLLRLTAEEFSKRLLCSSECLLSGLYIIRIMPSEFPSVPSVKFAARSDAEIGSAISMLGYSHRINQLHMKTGIISSYMDIRGEGLIVVEAYFEPGNQGSPLINVETDEVIGVVIDSFTSHSGKYSKIKQIVRENLKLLGKAKGNWVIGNIDPVQVLMANQHMLKFLARDIYLSGTRGFTFAAQGDRLLRYLRNLEHKRQITI